MAFRADAVVAKQVTATTTHLCIITRNGKFDIPWEKCSPKLDEAGVMERTRAELSPCGYGIHWPLLDEDLAVAPLIL